MRPPNDALARISAASAQGERDHQEDRLVHHTLTQPSDRAGWLLGIFDGHRGAATADQASKALVAFFEYSFLTGSGDVSAALRDVFAALHKLTQNQISGSTASVVFIPQDLKTVHVAVLGDSPVAVLDAQGAVHIGPEHNVRTNIQERASAEARGGIYQDGYLGDSDLPGIGLQMARSLGDRDLARVLNREPEIQTIPLGGSGIVLVGSDGLFSPFGATGPQQLTDILEKIRKGGDADAVVKDALDRPTGDNVTAVLWRL